MVDAGDVRDVLTRLSDQPGGDFLTTPVLVPGGGCGCRRDPTGRGGIKRSVDLQSGRAGRWRFSSGVVNADVQIKSQCHDWPCSSDEWLTVTGIKNEGIGNAQPAVGTVWQGILGIVVRKKTEFCMGLSENAQTSSLAIHRRLVLPQRVGQRCPPAVRS